MPGFARPFMFPPPPPGPPPGDTELYRQSRLDESPHQQQVFTPLALDDQLITSEKQKKKLEKELKSKQKEMAKQEKKEKEREEKKKEKLERKSAARSNMKANSVQGQPSMEDFRASDEDPIPVFLSRCIEFIEVEGLATE